MSQQYLRVAAMSGDLISILRERVGSVASGAETRKPFRFLLCGDPALVAEFRGRLLSGHEGDSIPLDAAATLETIDPVHRPVVMGAEVRCVIFLGRGDDVSGARLDPLRELGVPVFAVSVDPGFPISGPVAAPGPRGIEEYQLPSLDIASMRVRLFPHLVERCRGTEVAVGRRLPALRETVAIRLTRRAASSALKVAAASGIVDQVPVFGFVIGAVASAGDMVAITGMQVALMMQIGSVYGKDPDVQRVWEMLPVVGGGFGWRALARELSGFVPVAGIPIKGAIAYAGTIVVGEATTFFYEHGRHMTTEDAAVLYDETKKATLSFARDLAAKLRRR